ncbi:MAG: antitoxin component YwqK of YwqJK toxin-antitoxin module [Parvicellaceae bacterium]|jgi:antitoxin component YwqK of YwqJK toxin-antitoxin module
MKKLLPLLFVAFIFACSAEETGRVSAEDPTEVVKKVIPDGDYTESHKNGNVKVKGTILGGERFGTWVGYHSNGNKASESEYRNGFLNGKTVSYYENGQVRYIGYYENGEKAGTWQFFNKDGSPEREEKF